MNPSSNNIIRRFIPVLLLGLLLSAPSVSVHGAADGLLLWFNIVLPTLSPFLICTQLVVALDGVQLLTGPFYPVLHAVFGLSIQGCYVLLCGLLCGYPLGAKLCADFSRRGEISEEEARYLLSICNHPSPMFLLGYVRSQLGMSVSPLLLLCALYLPVIPVSWMSRRLYRDKSRRFYFDKSRHPIDVQKKVRAPLSACSYSCNTNSILSAAVSVSHRENTAAAASATTSLSLDTILLSTAETMVVIGGYIMLFSILAAWIGQLAILPVPVQAMLSGLAEITTGVHRICTVFPAGKSVLPTIAAVSFGGCSGIFQTASVIHAADRRSDTRNTGLLPHAKNAGLSIRHYAGWKAVHALLACVVLILMLKFKG